MIKFVYFSLEKQSLCREYGGHDAVTEVIRVLSFDLPTICFKYRLTYLLTPWSRVLLEKLTSKLCS